MILTTIQKKNMNDILIKSQFLPKRQLWCVIGLSVPDGKVLLTVLVDNAGEDEMEYIGIARAMHYCLSKKTVMTVKISSIKAYNWWIETKMPKSKLLYNSDHGKYLKLLDFMERSFKFLESIRGNPYRALLDFKSQEDNHKWTPMFTRYFGEEDLELDKKEIINETDKQAQMRERNNR